MLLYEHGADFDLPLLAWWSRLHADGELLTTLGTGAATLSGFLKAFPESVDIHYETDEAGWWIVAWCAPFMGGATWGLWVRSDKRASGSRDALRLIVSSLRNCLGRYPVLVNITRSPEIVAKTQRLGYTYVGVVPKLFDGQDLYIMQLTREHFDQYARRWEALWEPEK